MLRKLIICMMLLSVIKSITAHIPVIDPIMQFSTSHLLKAVPLIVGSGLGFAAVMKFALKIDDNDAKAIHIFCVGAAGGLLAVLGAYLLGKIKQQATSLGLLIPLIGAFIWLKVIKNHPTTYVAYSGASCVGGGLILAGLVQIILSMISKKVGASS